MQQGASQDASCMSQADALANGERFKAWSSTLVVVSICCRRAMTCPSFVRAASLCSALESSLAVQV
eukprot:3256725-Amphidinium_carterae.2